MAENFKTAPTIESPTLVDLEFSYLTSDLELHESNRITGRENRQNHLESLTIGGFETATDRNRVIDQIVSIGLPVDNYRSVVRRPNEHGRETVVGTWQEDSGQFSVYEHMYNTPHQERLATISHEGWHAVSPLRQSNERLYSSPEARERAEAQVKAVAEQSLLTGIHIDGYHKKLMADYRAGKIDKWVFEEETGAIMAEKALAGNRALLRDVQERQHRKVEDIARIARINGKPEPQKAVLISGEDLRHRPQGIDAALVDLIDEVDSLEGLVAHTNGLKEKFYPREDIAVAQERGTAKLPDAYFLARGVLMVAVLDAKGLRFVSA